MTFGGHVLEHGSTRPARWLREWRLRITFTIAAVEALLVVVHVLHWWGIVLIAVVAGALWWYAGRNHRSDVFRQVSWIAAVSQLLVVCVPLVLAIATTIAIAFVALFAIGALILLFLRRP